MRHLPAALFFAALVWLAGAAVIRVAWKIYYELECQGWIQ